MIDPLALDDQNADATSDPFQWRESLWIANAWLVFLIFPLANILVSDLATWRKLVGTALIALFSAVYHVAFRATAAREYGRVERPTGTRALWHRDGAWLYLIGMTLVTATAVGVTGWASFGLLPFLVSYAMFNYRWRTSLMIGGLVLAVSLLAPLVMGEIGEFWFFGLLVISVGAATAFSRMAEETQYERSRWETEFALSKQRSDVARDLHDVLGHSLTAVILKSQVCKQLLNRVEPADDDNRMLLEQCSHELAELELVSRSAMAEIRSTVGGLRVARLGDELIAARSVLADARAELTVQGDHGLIPEQYRATMAWMVRESVTNIVRHAQADSCTIEFAVADEPGLLMRIRDDGVGVGDSAEGAGMRGMRDRVEAIDATLRVESVEGTMIEVWV